MAAYTTLVFGLFEGIATVVSSSDGTITVETPAGETPYDSYVYSDGPIPTIPAGSTGLLINTIPGAGIVEPNGFGAVLDLAPGALTLTASSSEPQRIAVAYGGGQLIFSESGGSGIITDPQAIDEVPTGPGDSYTFSGGSYSLSSGRAASTIVAAGGTGSFTNLGAEDIVSLADGTYTLTGANDIVAATGGDFDISASNSAMYLGDGRFTVGIAGLGVSDDTIIGGAGAESILADQGDLIVNQSGSIVATLGTGVPLAYDDSTIPAGDTVFGGFGIVHLSGTAPTFANLTDGIPAEMTETDPAEDLIVGGAAGDNFIAARSIGTTIFGGGSGDILEAWGGAPGGDVIVAGPGAESIFGNGSVGQSQPNAFNFNIGLARVPSGNLLVGGSGADLIIGGTEHDTIIAGGGASTISTGAGGSLLQLGAGAGLVNLYGADTVLGGSGSATLGGVGGDLVFGAAGGLTFVNGSAASTVTGGMGSETIYAGAGGGVFQGGASAGNIFVGGAGNSVFYDDGGLGDLFVFANGAGGGTDIISGFDEGRDWIDLTGFDPGTAAASLSSATVAGGSLTITLPDATHVTFMNVATLSLAAFSQ